MKRHYRRRYKKKDTATIELTLDRKLIDKLIATMKKHKVSFTYRYVPKTLGQTLAEYHQTLTEYQAKQEEAFLRTLEQFPKLIQLINKKK